MDAKLAVNLLENTFKQKFDIERFEYFFIELFDMDIHTIEEKHYVKDTYKKYVNHFYNLGAYQSKFNERIGVYAVELSNESSRDRARTMQRNLIVDMMKKTNKDGALVAFYTEDSEDWRFSYIKKYFKFGENGVKEVLSAPRRHSFLVGPNEPNHTCQTQFLRLLISEDKISLKEIDDAFNIENVTDEFFNEYSDLVNSLVNSLTNIKEIDYVVREEFDSRYIQSSDFAKKLMGQLVFMYFLQKKGWLGVEKGEKWGTGPKDFLRKIFDKCQDEGKNFFNDVLEPLFYKGFAEEVGDFHYSEFGYKVPFLNGALFEPINNYDWVKTDVNLKNSIFDNIFKTFDKFNFTVKEDEPLEKEVAVDPEMLGKVFESLLESGDRKQKGAFYTPRHIVHYMCQENLISYLETNTDIPEDDLRKFITKGYLAIEHIIKVNDSGGKLKKIPHIRESIKQNSDKLDSLLKNVKVIDPAVGSGAFPVGMLNEIVTARYILRLINNVQEVDFYQLKKETIANSLYGVDLELSAADVTKLRFWLSLIVDEENIDEIEPLPNLDNQIMCGNSVIDGYENVRLFDEELIVRSAQTKLAMTPTEQIFEKLERKKREFFDVCGPVQKQKLRDEIKEIKWQFIEARLRSVGRRDLIEKIKEYKYRDDRPFFVWELEFSEIFKGENPGFDIVIGNPPYVRQEKIKEIKPYLKEHYKTFTGVADLYVYFFEKGLNILKQNGIFAFICSNKFTKAGYGKKLRGLLLKYQIKIYNDYTGIKIFKEAQVDTSVIQIKKQYLKLNEILVNNDFKLPQKYLNSKTFIFEKQEVLDLFNKINNKGVIIKNLDININYGIKTGRDEAFIIDEKTKNELLYKDDKNKDIIKPILRGRDIKKGQIYFKNKYIILTKNGINVKKDYPSIYEYLSQYETKLKNRYDQGDHWSNLRPCNYYDDFDKEKLVYPNMAPSLYTVIDDEKYITNPKCYILTSETINLKYLSAILSSDVLNFVFKFIGSPLGNGGYDIHKKFVQILPIVFAENSVEDEIIIKYQNYLEINKRFVSTLTSFHKIILSSISKTKLSKKLENFYLLSEENFLKELIKHNLIIQNDKIILNQFKETQRLLLEIQNNINKLDNEINNLIYEIYGLNSKEIKIIKKSLNK